MKKQFILFSLILILFLGNQPLMASSPKINFISKTADKKIDVFVNNKYFTSFIYPDNIEKQCLYPIMTPSGKFITRGYPIDPRPFERTDHPHHIGLWFNFGDVNGLDFWNNSSAIKPEEKPKYGSILLDKIIEMNKEKGELTTQSRWVDNNKKTLLSEKTTYRFSGKGDALRIIDRVTELTAVQKVTFTENKEGLLGLRVDRTFEEPVQKAEKFLDAKGNITETPILNNEGVNGVYRNAEGLTGNNVWGKKSKWVALRAQKDGEVITIVLIDNKKNPNYPAWSHARGYGLFAMNSFAGKAVDKDSKNIEFTLLPGEKVVFKHKILIGNDLSDKEINKFAK